MIDKELFEMPRDDERDPGPVPAIIAVSVVFWLLVLGIGYALAEWAGWL